MLDFSIFKGFTLKIIIFDDFNDFTWKSWFCMILMDLGWPYGYWVIIEKWWGSVSIWFPFEIILLILIPEHFSITARPQESLRDSWIPSKRQQEPKVLEAERPRGQEAKLLEAEAWLAKLNEVQRIKTSPRGIVASLLCRVCEPSVHRPWGSRSIVNQRPLGL